MDEEILPNFSVSGTFTYRKMVDLIWDAADRREVDRLHADRHAERLDSRARAYNVPLYALMRRRYRPAVVKPKPTARATISAIWAWS